MPKLTSRRSNKKVSSVSSKFGVKTSEGSTNSKGFSFSVLSQPRLKVGAANDPLERQADSMASQVTRNPADTFIRRKCEACEKEEKLQKKSQSATPAQLTGKSAESATAPSSISREIKKSSGDGSKLDPRTNHFMSARFGQNFDNVTIHNDTRASRLSDDLNAKAFTVGKDIYFNQNQYNPNSEEGRHLLAHELTHTIQQGNTAKRVQKLDLSLHSFKKGSCGQRRIRWVFALSNAAPEDGYIVQHIRSLETMAACPSDISYTELTPKLEFWEAWKVKKGEKLDWTTVQDGWTDGSTRPSNPNTSGTQTSLGTVKFFTQKVTGDLGDFEQAPVGNTAWGPGKVPTSGALPSTPTEPAWFKGAPTEGPANRWASSWWNCCGENSKHFSRVDSKP
jgi:hypothetical protein